MDVRKKAPRKKAPRKIAAQKNAPGKLPCNCIKKETQVISCKFWEISKNTFFTEHLWATASKLLLFLLPEVKYVLNNVNSLDQGSSISQIEWAPFKSLFWNTNDSIVNLRFLLQAAFLCETELVIKIF